MLTLHDLLFGLGVPGLVGTVLFLAARRFAGRDASPFALVLGFLAAQSGLFGWPEMPPAEAAEWFVFAALALGALAVARECAAGLSRYYVPLSLVVVMLPTLWLVTRPLAENSWTGVQAVAWIAGSAALAVTATVALDRLYARQPGPAASLSLVLLLIVAAVEMFLSGTMTYAQLLAGAAAALAPGAALAMLGLGPPFSRSVAPVFVLVLGGFLLAGRLYASLTTLNALLLLAAPLGFWLAELPALRRRPQWQRGLVGLVAVALPAVVAAGLALHHMLAETNDYY